MHFKLVDGKAIFATHRKGDEYFYPGDDIPGDAEDVEQPSQEIFERAERLKGKTYSKSEFEKMLFELTPEDRINELEKLVVELSLEGGG